jgi:hypothetical protein
MDLRVPPIAFRFLGIARIADSLQSFYRKGVIMKKRIIVFSMITFLLTFPSARAIHIQGVEDAGTVLTKGIEMELGGHYERWQRDESYTTAQLVFTCGLQKRLNGILEIPYLRLRQGESKNAGFGDLSIGMKYRFSEEGKLTPAIAVKALGTLPVGDESRDLGAGEVGYGLTAVTSKTWGKPKTHLNLGFGKDFSSYGLSLWYPQDRFTFIAELTGECSSWFEDLPGSCGLLFGTVYEVTGSVLVDLGINWRLRGEIPKHTFFLGCTFTVGNQK